MKLPNISHAVVDVGKLITYSLNPMHDVGQHKSRVFRAALGITLDDADWLREQVLQEIHRSEAVEGRLSPFGQTYVVDMVITRGEMSARVRTSWIIEHGTDSPRMTSCYVK
ncbi:MAG: hypothetical protein M3458_23075 [Acidobacteriota bacterium]|nr:hypothetical protein [Acidobacteriota bacterium]